jgi:hypothetical protein
MAAKPCAAKIEAAPKKMNWTALADELRPEFFEHGVG